jgi:two-component system, LytTR family, response regulator
MISAVLIDDEPKNNAILEKMLVEFCPEVTVAGKADNSRDGTELIRKIKPDLVFLDIEMPYGNAFDLLDRLKPFSFDVIFVTAFDNYSLKAFKYSALDYLLKPVDIEELKAAVERVVEKRKSQHVDIRQIELLLNNLKNPRNNIEKIALPSSQGLIFHDIQDIVRCEAQRGYTYIYLRSGQKIVSSRNIKEFEDLLPESLFFRIHNSHLVNLNFISKYLKGRGGNIEMTDGTVLEVATRRKDELLARFGAKGL